MPQAIPLIALYTGTAITSVVTTLQVAALATSVAVAQVQARKQARKAAQAAEAARRDLMVTIRGSVEPRRIIYGRRRVGGVLSFPHSSNVENRVLHQVLALAGHEIDAYERVYFNDDLLEFQGSTLPAATFSLETGGKYAIGTAAAARVTGYPGAPSQTADAALIAVSGGKWTAAHRGDGVAYAIVQTNWVPDIFTQGLPSVSAVVRGARLYDPRTGSTAWSRNAALVIRDYLLRVWPNAAIDEASFQAAANVCDEWITVNTAGNPDAARWVTALDAEVAAGTWESLGGGSYRQRRYTCDVTITEDDLPGDVLEKMQDTCAGFLTLTGGVWRLVAGAYTAPSLTLTADDLRDAPAFIPHPPRRDLANVIKGSWSGPSSNYVAAAYPAVTAPAFVTADGGELALDVPLEGISDPVRAQRRAQIALKRARLGTLSFPAKLGVALALRPGDTVGITLPLFGWTAKVFRVEGWALSDDLGVDLTLREDSADVWAWTLADAEVSDPAPDLTLPSPWIVSQPASLAAASGDAYAQVAEDGTVISRVRLTWAAGVDGNKIEIESRATGGTTWSPHPEADDSAGAALLAGMPAGAAMEIRARRRNAIGARSAWATVSHTVLGKDAPPPNVDTFAVTLLSGNTRRFQWSYGTPPADLAGFEVRYAAGGSITWATATRLFSHTAIPGQTAYSFAIVEPQAAGTWTFAIRAVDASSNLSTTPTTATATLPDITPQIPPNADYIGIYNALPSVVGYTGPAVIFLTTDGKLYRLVGGAWVKAVDAGDILGTITTTQIADGGITTPKLGALSVTAAKIGAGEVTAEKINVAFLSALSANLGVCTTGQLSINSNNAGDYGFVRSGTKWWADGVNGWVLARHPDGTSFLEMRSGDALMQLSSWGQNEIRWGTWPGGLPRFQVDALGNLRAYNAVFENATVTGNVTANAVVANTVTTLGMAASAATGGTAWQGTLDSYNPVGYNYTTISFYSSGEGPTVITWDIAMSPQDVGGGGEGDAGAGDIIVPRVTLVIDGFAVRDYASDNLVRRQPREHYVWAGTLSTGWHTTELRCYGSSIEASILTREFKR
jgi:hypothetical protein